MEESYLRATVLCAWQTVAEHVAGSSAAEFSGQRKETLVFRRLRKEIERIAPSVRVKGPDDQERFNNWPIDMVCRNGAEIIAIEGKYKIQSDGAVPDNRKAAFYDLCRLERYVDSGRYSQGLFLWLTNKRDYLKWATGDSRDFSTHNGRVYEPDVPLSANRSRNDMPLPLILTRRYVFNWRW